MSAAGPEEKVEGQSPCTELQAAGIRPKRSGLTFANGSQSDHSLAFALFEARCGSLAEQALVTNWAFVTGNRRLRGSRSSELQVLANDSLPAEPGVAAALQFARNRRAAA